MRINTYLRNWLTPFRKLLTVAQMTRPVRSADTALYLAATQYHSFSPRRCRFLRRVTIEESGGELLEVALDPPAGYRGRVISKVLLHQHFSGPPVTAIDHYPYHVHILWPYGEPSAQSRISSRDFNILDWGVIFDRPTECSRYFDSLEAE